ncbi:hypothetical protein GCM10010302_16890 [Streptomyces polychromogenes]|uniref:Secreted protein n=1 Tax=Streptomyces polychromogenes TaxID=67342 RepID=A0ABP3EVH9_9ACTN
MSFRWGAVVVCDVRFGFSLRAVGEVRFVLVGPGGGQGGVDVPPRALIGDPCHRAGRPLQRWRVPHCFRQRRLNRECRGCYPPRCQSPPPIPQEFRQPAHTTVCHSPDQSPARPAAFSPAVACPATPSHQSGTRDGSQR